MAGTLNIFPDVQAVSNGNALFSSKLHRVLRDQDESRNLVFSPFSVSAVVAMATLGAAGNTKAEMESVLHLPGDQEMLKFGYSKVMASLQVKTKEFSLFAANKVCSSNGFVLKPGYNSTIQYAIGADIEQLDFSKPAESAKIINEWAEKVTENKIKNLLSPGALSDMMQIILLNAVYFKGYWETPFNPAETHKRYFHVSKSEIVDVDMMMSKLLCFKYAEFEDLPATAVELPYKGNRLSMLVYVPREGTTLQQVEEKLVGKVPHQLLKQFRDNSRKWVLLPRFKIESDLPLVNPLKKLGISEMFNPVKADFSGISEAPLYVADIIQKAIIEVNEEGTEAAARTYMSGGGGPVPMTFMVDRPFVFQIVDKQTNLVLFAGSCVNPNA